MTSENIFPNGVHPVRIFVGLVALTFLLKLRKNTLRVNTLLPAELKERLPHICAACLHLPELRERGVLLRHLLQRAHRVLREAICTIQVDRAGRIRRRRRDSRVCAWSPAV